MASFSSFYDRSNPNRNSKRSFLSSSSPRIACAPEAILMAIGCSPPHVAISGGFLRKKPETRVFMLHNSHMPPKEASNVLIRSFTIKKVYEDQSRGIVCYRDDRGEMICEEYDEGPRFRQTALQKIYQQSLPEYREFQILDFLRATRLLQGNGFRCIEEGVAVREDD